METPEFGKKDEISCTYCVQSPVPATRTCLHCEASLCEEHVKVHSKSTEHILVEPTTSIKDMKCSIHNKVIEFCCSKDGACICVSCCIIGEHRGHKVDPLKEAFEKRKASFKDSLDNLALEREENEKKLERLLEKRDNMQGTATGVTERVAALFRDMSEQLEALQARAMTEVSRQEQQVMVRVNGLIEQLEKKKDELSKKMNHLEELRNVTNPLTVLRGTSHEQIKCRNSQKTNESDNDIQVSSSVDEGPVSLILHIGLLNFAENLQDLKALRQFTGIKKADVTFDVNTAQHKILVSSDLKLASHSTTSQKYPETPERFKSCQVLSTNEFTAGQHYWEVDVSKAKRWIIGVALKSIERKIAGNESFLGYNKKSWTLFYQKFLGVSHNNVQNTVVSDSTVQGVGIYLDYDAGYLSFYQLNPSRHLHTFTATFDEPLHAAFYIFDDSCIKIIS
ncbi:tripartite motif-containing protein 16-like [Hyla sarda]|uniref:tripartite motif-containing protein 16-like n=1 Tax=Hyla sarda TaxID=327740 RepID=UPI0024C232E5|nr:tripartite motif-containing protein 16-like [Hyla sarda]